MFNSRFKLLLAACAGLACAGGLVWLLYLNGNYNRMEAPGSRPEGAGASPWFNSAGATPARSTPRDSPVASLPPALAVPTLAGEFSAGSEQTAFEAHYIDPATQRAIKTLLTSNQPVAPPSGLAGPGQLQAGRYNPLGSPSITLEAFQHFLKQGDSPALPEAAAMYNVCVRLFCDPAVALAFFQHESSMGREGAAARNKSLGNIRCVPDSSAACRATQGNGSFRTYSTWTDGMTDWIILMRETYAAKWKLYSLEQIIPRYAPSADNNNPPGYISAVKSLVDKYRAYRGR